MVGCSVLSISVLDVPGQCFSIVAEMRLVRTHVLTLSQKGSEFSALAIGTAN